MRHTHTHAKKIGATLGISTAFFTSILLLVLVFYYMRLFIFIYVVYIITPVTWFHFMCVWFTKERAHILCTTTGVRCPLYKEDNKAGRFKKAILCIQKKNVAHDKCAISVCFISLVCEFASVWFSILWRYLVIALHEKKTQTFVWHSF